MKKKLLFLGLVAGATAVLVTRPEIIINLQKKFERIKLDLNAAVEEGLEASKEKEEELTTAVEKGKYS